MASSTKDQVNTLDISAITKILPHRYPFLLIDKVIDFDLEKAYILGQKNVSMNEAFFQGHLIFALPQHHRPVYEPSPPFSY